MTTHAEKASSDATEARKQLTHLAGALKASRITEAAARLADHARDTGWTHEEYLAAVLDREAAARNASGTRLPVRVAEFCSRKTIEEFDWDAQPAGRPQVASLATGGFLTGARNIVHRVLFTTVTEWVTRLTRSPRRTTTGRPRTVAALRADRRRRSRYLPYEQDTANLFFQQVNCRYEHAPLILTSHLSFNG
ncbi:ATP-binding protein [Aeromicrobium wangtongii]|uniref:ATP-binding protein n=1 Tax=Aeromicrobium wangtongii TaxID=2969247 RepID=A0ABY5MBV5_9ACTN|nr:ATP-binding protein [Aeromicrobium wangtongii]MCD9196949.1 ATP-binding protein [Aeromicrobium wangtongii]UUP14455.1 ATP-binding protein [Aeromicrobium wangtongii]